MNNESSALETRLETGTETSQSPFKLGYFLKSQCLEAWVIQSFNTDSYIYTATDCTYFCLYILICSATQNDNEKYFNKKQKPHNFLNLI